MTNTLDIPDAGPTALAPVNPLAMLQGLIDRGADPEALSKMMDLAERWQANEAKKQFAVAMNACQAEMPTIVRDKTNNETGKKYAPLETIKTWSKPIYTKHGFSLSFTSESGVTREATYPEKDGTIRTERIVTTTTHLDVTHTGGHTQRTTLPDVPLDDKGPKGGAVKTQVQGLMSSMSYAQGRLICLAFNLTVDNEDRDGQALAGELSEEKAAEVERLLKETGASRARFLTWLNVTKVEDIAAKDYVKAVNWLNEKKNGGAK